MLMASNMVAMQTKVIIPGAEAGGSHGTHMEVGTQNLTTQSCVTWIPLITKYVDFCVM